MGSSEAVEEVHERNPGCQGGFLGDKGEVHDFLHRVGAEHGEAGLADGHDVTVIAKNGKTLAGQGAGGDVEDRTCQFAGDLVHIGDHQQKALGSRKGGGQSAGGQSAVHGAGSAAFGLKFGN